MSKVRISFEVNEDGDRRELGIISEEGPTEASVRRMFAVATEATVEHLHQQSLLSPAPAVSVKL